MYPNADGEWKSSECFRCIVWRGVHCVQGKKGCQVHQEQRMHIASAKWESQDTKLSPVPAYLPLTHPLVLSCMGSLIILLLGSPSDLPLVPWSLKSLSNEFKQDTQSVV